MAGWRERWRGGARRGTSPQPPEPASWAAPTVAGARRAPLADGEDRAAALRRRAESDLPGAIAALEKLAADHAPDAHVLHALCLLCHRAGRVAEAVSLARRALPLCFKRNLGLLAAEIFESLDADAEAIGLGRDELLALGGALGRTVHWPIAFRALAGLAMRDPADAAAVRELLRMAEWQLDVQGAAAEAETICGFLHVAGADPALLAPLEQRLAPAGHEFPGPPAEFDAVRWLAGAP